jgi:hypothetical protein
MKELAVDINILPHGACELASLGLLPELDRVAIRTRELRCLTTSARRFGWAGAAFGPGTTSQSTAASCEASCGARHRCVCRMVPCGTVTA